MSYLAKNEQKVQHIIRNYPECKDDYKALMRKFWQVFDGLHEIIDRELFDNLTPESSIKRAYRNVKRKSVEDQELEQKYREYYSK